MTTLYKRRILAMVIHHTGDGLSPQALSIEQRWNPQQYEYPAYDYGIEFDGTIKTGRPLNFLGAHTKADKAPRNGDLYWYNKNGIGIALAGDFTKHAMPSEQYQGLLKLTRKLMADYQIPIQEIKAHRHVAYTLCPGDWDFERFKDDLRKGGSQVENLVVYGGNDFAAADLLAHYLLCPVIQLDRYRAKPIQAEKIYMIGGKTSPVEDAVLLAGADRYETMQTVLDFIQKSN